VTTTTSGAQLEADQVVGGRAERDDHRRLFTDERTDRLQVTVVGGTHDDDRAAGDPGDELGQPRPLSSRSCSRRMKLAGVVGEGVHLHDQSAAGLVHLAVHPVEVQRAAAASSSLCPSDPMA